MPRSLFRQPDLRELRRAQVRLVGAEELVELRRLDRRAGEHRVRLPAVVDLVLEEMREQARRASRARCPCGAWTGDGHVELRVGERRAGGDQPVVDGALRGCELGARRERLLRIEEASRRRGLGGSPRSARSSAST